MCSRFSTKWLVLASSLILLSGWRAGEVHGAAPDSAPAQEHKFTTKYTYYDEEPLTDLVKTQTDAAGRVTKYSYDDWRRLTKIAYADGKSVEYEYDKLGRRAAMKDTTGTTRYKYDTLNRLVRVDQSNGLWVEFEYDWEGRIKAVITPQDSAGKQQGWRVDYRYDLLGHLAHVDTPVGRFTWEYDHTKGTVTRRMPNGVATTFRHRPDGLLDSIRHEQGPSDRRGAASGLLAEFSYKYDPAGRVVSETLTTPSGSETTQFAYDLAGRLNRVGLPGGKGLSYQYDTMGNRIQQSGPGGTTNYAYDRWDQLQHAGDATFGHDALGNLAWSRGPDGVTRYTYGPANRLLAVDSPSGSVRYTFDGEGRLLGREAGVLRANYLSVPFGDTNHLLAQAEGGSITHRYVYGERLLYSGGSGRSEFYLEDRMGSVRLVTDQNQSVLHRYNFTPFGEPLHQSTHTGLTPAFAGAFFDHQTRLVPTTMRAYQPQLGRFVSPLQQGSALSDQHAVRFRYTSPTVVSADPFVFDRMRMGSGSELSSILGELHNPRDVVQQWEQGVITARAALASAYGRLGLTAAGFFVQGAEGLVLTAGETILDRMEGASGREIAGGLARDQLVGALGRDDFLVPTAARFEGNHLVLTLRRIENNPTLAQGARAVGFWAQVQGAFDSLERVVRGHQRLNESLQPLTLQGPFHMWRGDPFSNIQGWGTVQRTYQASSEGYEPGRTSRQITTSVQGTFVERTIPGKVDSDGTRSVLLRANGASKWVQVPSHLAPSQVAAWYDNEQRVFQNQTAVANLIRSGQTAIGLPQAGARPASAGSQLGAEPSAGQPGRTATMPGATQPGAGGQSRTASSQLGAEPSAGQPGRTAAMPGATQPGAGARSGPAGGQPGIEASAGQPGRTAATPGATQPGAGGQSRTAGSQAGGEPSTGQAGRTAAIENVGKSSFLEKAFGEFTNFMGQGSRWIGMDRSGAHFAGPKERDVKNRRPLGDTTLPGLSRRDELARQHDIQDWVNWHAPSGTCVEVPGPNGKKEYYTSQGQSSGSHNTWVILSWLGLTKNNLWKEKPDHPESVVKLEDLRKQFPVPTSVRVVVGYVERADEMTVAAVLGLSEDDLSVTWSDGFVEKRFGNTRWSTLWKVGDQKAVLVYDGTGEAPEEGVKHVLEVVAKVRELAGVGDKKVTVVLVGDPDSPEYKAWKKALEEAGVTVVEARDDNEGYAKAKEHEAQVMVRVRRGKKKDETPGNIVGEDRKPPLVAAASDEEDDPRRPVPRRRRTRRQDYPDYWWWGGGGGGGGGAAGMIDPDWNRRRYFPPPPPPPPPGGGGLALASAATPGGRWPPWPPGGGGGGAMAPMATRVGGVRLDQAATVLGEIGEITTLSFDPETGRLVLLGEKGKTALPAMRLDDLAVVIHSIYVEGVDPFLSIDPKKGDLFGPKMDVLYSPGLMFTHAGRVMFLTDYKLKEYAAGGRAGVRLTSTVSGYRSLNKITEDLLARDKDQHSLDPRVWFRFWLVPNDIALIPSNDGKSLIFQHASVRVETENMILKEGQLVRVHDVKDPIAEEFVRHFTKHYNEFAAEYPAYEELRRLAQIVGLVKWMHQNGVEVDLSWVDRHRNTSESTPLETDSVRSEGVVRHGSGTQSVHRFFGGVVMSMRVGKRVEQSGVPLGPAPALTPEQTERLRALMQTVEKAPEHESWRPTEAAQGVVVPGVPRRMIGAYRTSATDLVVGSGADRLALTRHYNSLFTEPTAFGRGWTMLLPRLYRRQPLPRETTVRTRQPDGRETTLPIYVLTDDFGFSEHVFCPAPTSPGVSVGYLCDSAGALRQFLPQAGATPARVVFRDGRVWEFDEQGCLLTEQSRGYSVRYHYDALPGGRRLLRRIARDSAGSPPLWIALDYDTQHRIAQVVGSDGSRVAYRYGKDDLTSAAGPLETLAYTYDANHLLTQVFRDANRVERVAYDELGRLAAIYGPGDAKQADYRFQSLPNSRLVVEEREQHERLTYDAQRRLAAVERPGVQTGYGYYRNGALKEIVDRDDGGENRISYSEHGDQITWLTPSGASLDYALDASGSVRSMNVNGSRIGQFRRNPATGAIEEAVFPTFQYRQITAGNRVVREIVSPTGELAGDRWPIDLQYTADGNLTRVRGPAGMQLEVEYEGSRVRGIATSRQTVRIDEEENVQTVTSSDGRRVALRRNPQGEVENILETVDGVSRERRFVGGRLTEVRDYDQGITKYDWDERTGLLIGVTDPMQSSIRYRYQEVNGEFRVAMVELPNQRTIVLETDRRGRVTGVRE